MGNLAIFGAIICLVGVMLILAEPLVDWMVGR